MARARVERATPTERADSIYLEWMRTVRYEAFSYAFCEAY
jgi:hypothetical protein